ncbi:MAG: hypothetical protein ACOH2F_18555 [Cellulomonas sp.]
MPDATPQVSPPDDRFALVPLPDVALAVARLLVQLGQAAQMRRAARRAPLLRAPRGPADPYARTRVPTAAGIGWRTTSQFDAVLTTWRCLPDPGVPEAASRAGS